jgi:hypothetical protein
MSYQHLILVLGMHRSGTSLVARSLRCLGAKLGPAAEWSGPDNITGHWEHQGILTANETLLGQMGTSWDATEDLTEKIAVGHALNPAFLNIERAVTRTLTAELNTHSPFGLKEPRLCRLLQFYGPILEDIGCKVSVVHVVRHPAEVAKSLARRNRMQIDHALRLWLAYNRDILRDVDPAWPMVTVTYEGMMTLPYLALNQMAEVFGLTVDEVERREFTYRFIDRALWHEVDEQEMPLPLDVAMLWKQLARKAA